MLKKTKTAPRGACLEGGISEQSLDMPTHIVCIAKCVPFVVRVIYESRK